MTTYARPCPPPINALPIELLSYIFVLGTYETFDQHPGDDDAEWTPTFTTESVKAPLILASVSRYWRRVALDTPALWTRLCITMEMVHPFDGDLPERLSSSSASCSSSNPSMRLDTRHITSYLSLSRRYPLDILIDARDPDWDFLEDDISSDSESQPYTPPFSAEHIKTVLELLLPHLSRWRSLNILTDTWKPMHTALHCMNVPLLTHGAPLLESLSLMRCNDFISFSPEFQPKSLKGPAFLATPSPIRARSSPLPPSDNILPRLKHLSLRGVHVDWTSLGAALSSSKTGLHSLDLCSHSADVRPSLSEFRHLLSSNPRLRKLSISGSGPFVPPDLDDAVDLIYRRLGGVVLPDLASLSVGYRCTLGGQAVLQLLDAPALKTLALEEATYPADPEEIDAGSLLTYIGTGEFETPKERYLVASSLPNAAAAAAEYQTKSRKDSTSSIASTSTCVGSAAEVGGRLYDDDDDMTLVDFDTKPHMPFPLLESVTLKNVRTCSGRPMGAFFGALSHLRHLELVGMPMDSVHALLPDSSPSSDSEGLSLDSSSGPSSSSLPASTSSSCPCPELRSLWLRDVSHMHAQDLDFVLNKFVSERRAQSQSQLENIDIHLGPGEDFPVCHVDMEDGQDLLAVEKAGVRVNVFRHALSSYDEEDDEEWDDDDSIADGVGAFKAGGVFNDPYFDAYYGGESWLNGR